MKRRDFFYTLSLLPLIALAACKKGFPSSETTVKGKIVDENNLPVEGVEAQFFGRDKKGVTGSRQTFNVSTQTDKEGNYKVAYIIPSDTDETFLDWLNNDKFMFGKTHDILRERDGKYDELGIPSEIRHEDYGKTIIINFQVKKR